MAADELIIKIGAETSKFKSELDKVKSQVKDLEKGLATTAKISAAAFVGLAAAAGLAVKSFAKFEDGFSDVVTLLDKSAFKTKTFEQGINDMKSGVIELGAATGESFDVLNKALFDTVSAGVSAGDSIEFLAAATNLAIAGATDTSIAVDGMTSAMNAFGLDASQATEISQKFFVAQVGGKTTVEEMANSFGKAGATANAYGVSLDELLGAISAVTLGGVKTSAAYTGFNAVLAGIAKPTKDAAEEAKRLGIQFDTTALRTQGLTGFLNTLRNANGFTQKSVEKLFGSVEAQKVAFALTGSQADAYASQIKALGDKQKLAGDFTAALATKNATAAKSMAKLSQSVKAVAITIGEQLAPNVIKIADSLSNALKKFNKFDDTTKGMVGTLIKWGLAISGGIASLAAIGLASLKASAIIGALTATFGPAVLGASAFWVAITGPIGLAVAGIAAVSAGAFALFKVFQDPKEPKSLKEINNELDKLKEKEAKLSETAHVNRVGQANRSQKRLEEIQKEIKGLENLQQAGISASEDFGDGTLLIRPEIEQTSGDPAQDIVDKILGGQDSLKIPLSIEGQEDGAIEAKAKEDAAKLSAIKAEEAQKSLEIKEQQESDLLELDREASAKRTQAKLSENSKLREINDAKNQGLTDQEIGFIEQLQALDDQAKSAKEIKNEEEKQAELDNLSLKNSEVLAALDEFNLQKADQEAEDNERKKALNEELREMEVEQTEALNEQDLKVAQAKINTQEEAERIHASEKLNRQIQERNKFKQDEIKHGTEVAQLKRTLASEEVQNFKSTAANLEQLTQSKNSKLKAIGKAAAHTNAAIKTAEGAIAAYTSLAGIPFVGPALGAAAAGALLAFGVEQQQTIARMAQGGIVPGGQGGSRDRIPALLEPGELVVPKGITSDFVQSVGRPDISAEEGGGNVQQIEIGFTDNAFEIIERKQNEDVALGIREAN